jgi:hypothetical protein
MPNWLATAALALFVVTAALLLTAFSAPAHDWYPRECCSGQDCAPVDSAVMAWNATTERSELVVTTKHGTVRVPPSFPRQPSPDGRMHACMVWDDAGGMSLLCLWMPPSS